MNLSDEQLLEIEDFAYKYLQKEDIALIMGIKDLETFKDENNPVYLAFWKGRLKRRAQFNFNVMQLSDQLSSPAQNIEGKIAEKTYLNDHK